MNNKKWWTIKKELMAESELMKFKYYRRIANMDSFELMHMSDTISCGTFIVYKGTEYTVDTIVSELKKRAYNSTIIDVKEVSKNILFAKAFETTMFNEGYESFYDDDNSLIVNGYRQSEFSEVLVNSNNPNVVNLSGEQLIGDLYSYYGTEVFVELMNYGMHFCSVIYDKKSNKIIAGINKPSSKFTHLFYGYTRQNHELMFSNLLEILTEFCDEVWELNSKTYMFDDGEIHSIFGSYADEHIKKPLIKKIKN